MSITIRLATAGDAPAIARVGIDGWRTDYRGLVPDAGVDAMDVDASVALWLFADLDALLAACDTAPRTQAPEGASQTQH